jgi:hypothetical protein
MFITGNTPTRARNQYVNYAFLHVSCDIGEKITSKYDKFQALYKWLV